MRLLPLIFLSLAACGGDPETCSEASCDGVAEMCVLLGSDVEGEPDVATCEPLPSTCAAGPSCACVEQGDDETAFNLEFCFDEGACDDSGDVVEVICPGG